MQLYSLSIHENVHVMLDELMHKILKLSNMSYILVKKLGDLDILIYGYL